MWRMNLTVKRLCINPFQDENNLQNNTCLLWLCMTNHVEPKHRSVTLQNPVNVLAKFIRFHYIIFPCLPPFRRGAGNRVFKKSETCSSSVNIFRERKTTHSNTDIHRRTKYSCAHARTHARTHTHTHTHTHSRRDELAIMCPFRFRSVAGRIGTFLEGSWGRVNFSRRLPD